MHRRNHPPKRVTWKRERDTSRKISRQPRVSRTQSASDMMVGLVEGLCGPFGSWLELTMHFAAFEEKQKLVWRSLPFHSVFVHA